MYPESCPHPAGAGKEASLPSDTWGNDPGQVWEGCHKLMFLKDDDTKIYSLVRGLGCLPNQETYDT